MSKYAISQTCYALCTSTVLCVFCVLHALMMNASRKGVNDHDHWCCARFASYQLAQHYLAAIGHSVRAYESKITNHVIVCLSPLFECKRKRDGTTEIYSCFCVARFFNSLQRFNTARNGTQSKLTRKRRTTYCAFHLALWYNHRIQLSFRSLCAYDSEPNMRSMRISSLVRSQSMRSIRHKSIGSIQWNRDTANEWMRFSKEYTVHNTHTHK